MADENVPTAQPAPEDPGVDPAESATSGQASTDNASSAIPQSDGAAPDLVHAGPSSVPTARESIGAQTVRLANNPVYMEDLRSRDAELYDYMVAVRDRRTSDPRSLDLGIRLPTGEPGVHGRLPHRETITMNGTLNGTTNGATHLNGAPRRTLNGPTPETRREVDRPSFPPGWLPPHGEPEGTNVGGMRRRITPGIAATGGADRIEQLQRQRNRTDDEDEEGGAED